MIVRKLKTAAFVFATFAVLVITAKQLEKEDYVQFFENNDSDKKTALIPAPQKSTALFPSAPNKDLVKKTENKRTIKVINHMDDKKGLTYNHTTGKYKPKEFKLLVNNTENAHIERKKNFIKEAEQEIEIINNTVYIDYDFKFIEYCGAYTRGGKRRIEIKVEDDADSLEIDFSWKNKDHIEVVKHGSIVSAIDVTI